MVASMLRQAQPPQADVEPVETPAGEKSYDGGLTSTSSATEVTGWDNLEICILVPFNFIIIFGSPSKYFIFLLKIA